MIACSADLEPVVEELQQAFFKLADFLGGLKSKVLGGAPGLAARASSAGSVSLLDTAAQPIMPASLAWVQTNESQTADERCLWNALGDVAIGKVDDSGPIRGVAQWGLQDIQANEPDFELPTASQMPLRYAGFCCQLPFIWPLNPISWQQTKSNISLVMSRSLAVGLRKTRSFLKHS